MSTNLKADAAASGIFKLGGDLPVHRLGFGAMRVIGPDATIALDFALNRMAGVIDKLVIYPKRMQQNMEALRGLIFSQRVLLALTQTGMSREDAYKLVQKHAMGVWEEGKDFLAGLSRDKEVTAKLKPAQLKALFDLKHHTKHVDTIFKRVFGAK